MLQGLPAELERQRRLAIQTNKAMKETMDMMQTHRREMREDFETMKQLAASGAQSSSQETSPVGILSRRDSVNEDGALAVSFDEPEALMTYKTRTPQPAAAPKGTTDPDVYSKFQGGFVGNFATVKDFHGGPLTSKSASWSIRRALLTRLVDAWWLYRGAKRS